MTQKTHAKRETNRHVQRLQSAEPTRKPHNEISTGLGQSADSQIALLKQLSTPQQQLMLQRIGQRQGNQHVTRLTTRIQREAESAADNVSTQDIQYEVVAHHIAYQDEISAEAGQLLQRWGYQPSWHIKVNDVSSGLFVGLIMPDEQHRETLTPILAFRGTETDGAKIGYRDVTADLHPVAVGYNQFTNNRHIIRSIIENAGGHVDVTGHSLGGALAQHVAVDNPDAIGRVVTFQAPGVTADQAAAFQQQEEQPNVVHHIADGDIVDTAGEANLDGTTFRHDVGGWLGAHTRFLLLTPEFKARREALGLTDEKLTAMGIEIPVNQAPVTEHEEYPHSVKRGIDETGRSGIGTVLYPILQGFNLLFRDDDTDVRALIMETDDATLKGMPMPERAYAIDRLRRGWTGNADEEAIVRMVAISAEVGDLPAIFRAVNLWDLCNSVHGDQYQALHDLLLAHLYPAMDIDTAYAAIVRCMDGMTTEWQEEMIADILVVHPNARTLITQLGDGDFSAGLNRVEWQLDGSDQRRVEGVHGKSGRWF